jgi:hypothetical protein
VQGFQAILAATKKVVIILETSGIFTQRFLEGLQKLVDHHHFIFPTIPPQGIYFEALVERAFKQVRQPATRVKPKC